EAYRVQETKIREAVADLRNATEAKVRVVINSGLDPQQEALFNDKQNIIEFYIQQFGRQRFIQRDIDSGDFAKARDRVVADIQALQSFVRTESIDEWVKGLGELRASSDELNQFWEERKQYVKAVAKQLGVTSPQLPELQDATLRLRDVLRVLDEAIPEAPRQLRADARAAAGAKRDKVLHAIIQNKGLTDLSQEPGGEKKIGQLEVVKTAASQFRQWTEDLKALVEDFRLPRILTPDVRPDQKWMRQRPEFLKDRR